MSERRRLTARLAHDVGKYVARMARNVADAGPVPPALLPLICKDLYALPGDRRASERFEELACALEPDPRLERARAHLRAIDALEPRLRDGDLDAALEACRAAREVERALRELAKESA